MESKCFLSYLLTHKSWQRLGLRLHTYCLSYPHASAFLPVLAQCTAVSHWRRLQMSPRTQSFPPPPPSSHIVWLSVIRLKKTWSKRVSLYWMTSAIAAPHNFFYIFCPTHRNSSNLITHFYLSEYNAVEYNTTNIQNLNYKRVETMLHKGE